MNLWLELAPQLELVAQLVAPESQGSRFDSCQGPIVRFNKWLDVINVYKFTLVNFHLENSSTNIYFTVFFR